MAGETSSGAADRSGSGEAGRADDPWRKIETQQVDRDRAARAHDARHDPSPEFEYAARPLGEDYGRDRPRHRDLTPEQRTELEETFGRPADELLALREKDPRAGHNRDEQGRILDTHGNPRPERTPEQTLREAERQAHLHRPDTAAETDSATAGTEPEPAPSRHETALEESGDGSEQNPPHDPGKDDLGKLVGEIATELRSGRLTPREAAERLERFRENAESTAPEPTTETVRTEQTDDKERHYQRDTPLDTADTSGERTATEQSDKVSSLRRKADAYAQTGEVVPEIKTVVQNVDSVIEHRLPPGSRGETTVRQPDMPTIESRGHGDVDAGNVLAAGLAVTIAGVVYAQRLRDKIGSRDNQQKE